MASDTLTVTGCQDCPFVRHDEQYGGKGDCASCGEGSLARFGSSIPDYFPEDCPLPILVARVAKPPKEG